MINPDCVVLVFSKAPVPGNVKTRLLPALSANAAARLYRELLERTLCTVTSNARWHTQLWCTPVTDDPCFIECRDKYQLQLRLQSGSDIGERMYRAIAANLPQYQSLLLVGCDCPELQSADLETARDKLANGYDIVLGPATDGGYWLIGLRKHEPRLFEGIPWSTDTVFCETLKRAKEMRLSVHQLRERRDIDTETDWLAFAKAHEIPHVFAVDASDDSPLR